MESVCPTRLGSVEGFLNKRNEIIYHPSKVLPPTGCIIFFGGDMQDYKEKMLSHRDNKHYSKWDLESTTTVLHNQFPNHAIFVVKPLKMALLTFSCYENFVKVNNFGAPTYEKDDSSLRHLKSLLCNIDLIVHEVSDSSISKDFHIPDIPLTLVGFSKGCVVLNQFLYSFHFLKENPNQELEVLVNKISDMYWLDGGHSGESSIWITDKEILHCFTKLRINVHIHVTPYQVCCDTRPRIGKEEKSFREILRKLNANVKRQLHFETNPRSLERHFEVLEIFAQANT